MVDDTPDSIWLYPPSFALAILGTILYALPTAVQIFQTVSYRTWYFIPVGIGGILELVGYIFRVYSVRNQNLIPPYAVQQSLIVLAPLFFGAGDYVLASRLCAAVLPPTTVNSKIYRIPTLRLTRIFVACDIFTFLVQVSGSGIASSNNWQGKTVDIGINVLIAGLALQLATFVFFVAIIARFDARTKTGVRVDVVPGWKTLLKAVYMTSGLIIVRSIYRLIEFALGIFGYPFTHEWMFYVFEAFPMLITLTVFCIFHPGRLLGPGRYGKGSADIPLQGSSTDGV